MDLSAAGQEEKIDIKPEDLREIGELGQGNGGSVKKVEHVPTGKIMAKKARLSCNSRFISSSVSAFASRRALSSLFVFVAS